jgi:acyl carrier protein
MTETLNRLVAILVKDYNLERGALNEDALLEELGIDSLGLAELLFTIEDEFKIDLPQVPVALRTIADVVRYIDELVAFQRAAPAATAGTVTGENKAPLSTA